ncbi:unnamed protein product [Caenorhabditis nigoni]
MLHQLETLGISIFGGKSRQFRTVALTAGPFSFPIGSSITEADENATTTTGEPIPDWTVKMSSRWRRRPDQLSDDWTPSV